jgi:5-oxoprolinase (ATP-hydrolysing) subunit C
MIRVLKGGALCTIQDLGRHGFRSFGVGQGGALDSLALRIANFLVGNPPNSAGLEITLGPVELRFERPCWISLTGADFGSTLDGDLLYPGWRVPVRLNQILRFSHARTGMRAYLAIDGGIMVSSILGSRGTDLNNGFGGLQGRGIRLGDELVLGKPNSLDGRKGIQLPRWSSQIRVICGPEYDEFTEASRTRFWIHKWKITPQSNRMGYRTQGEELLELQKPRELLSHGVIPGVIQVPPNGQPIVLLADAQTTGGYPRIGVVIEADLWKLAQIQVGKTLQFKSCTQEEARLAREEQVTYLKRLEWSLYRG